MQQEFDESELKKADNRVGKSTKDVITWALSFLQSDLDNLPQNNWLYLRYEISALCKYHSLWDPEAYPRPEVYLTNEEGSKIPFHKLLDEDQVKHLQRKIKTQILDPILARRPLALGFPIYRTICFRPAKNGLDPCGEIVTSMDPLVVFHYFLFEAFKKYAHRICRCPQIAHKKCAGLFLAKRRDQKFCSTQCQNRVGQKRYRKEHGLITGRRPGRPAKGTPGTKKGGSRHGKKRR